MRLSLIVCLVIVVSTVGAAASSDRVESKAYLAGTTTGQCTSGFQGTATTVCWAIQPDDALVHIVIHEQTPLNELPFPVAARLIFEGSSTRARDFCGSSLTKIPDDAIGVKVIITHGFVSGFCSVSGSDFSAAFSGEAVASFRR